MGSEENGFYYTLWRFLYYHGLSGIEENDFVKKLYRLLTRKFPESLQDMEQGIYLRKKYPPA